MEFRRVWKPGGCYFFTVVTHQRRRLFDDANNVQRLRDAFSHIRNKHPFSIDAMVVMPDHLHCIWQLPEGDVDYPLRWRLIKHSFSRGMAVRSHSARLREGEQPVWQRRYWEHCIRNEQDWQHHVDYIHFNPVKHGYVASPVEWAYSSFHRAVEEGLYDPGWGQQEPDSIRGMDFE